MLKLFNRLFAPSGSVLSAPGVSEQFARMLTDKNNPDHILLSYILRSLATEYSAWKLYGNCRGWSEVFNVGTPRSESNCYSTGRSTQLQLIGTDITVKIEMNYRTCDFTFVSHSLSVSALSVNNAQLNPDLGLKFARAVNDIRLKQEAIEKAAKTAKAEMEANEEKWNLVENVLGLKRLEDGTLVAKQSAE